MSEYRFNCPRCGQKFTGDEQWAGKQMLCPACQRLIIVPRLPKSASSGSTAAVRGPAFRVAPPASPERN